MRFAYHADDVIVMFTFVEEMPLKKHSSLDYSSNKKGKKKSPNNSLIELVDL